MVLAEKTVNGKQWFQVQALSDSPCEVTKPKVSATGWLPALSPHRRSQCLVLFARLLKIQNQTLQRMLNLTDIQCRGVSHLQASHQNFLSEKSLRLNQVNRESHQEYLRPQPDPLALALRYFEIAAICRASTNSFNTYKSGLRNLLNPQQQSQLTQLEAYKNQLPALGEAQTLSLAPDGRTNWRARQLYGTFTTLPGCPSGGNSFPVR